MLCARSEVCVSLPRSYEQRGSCDMARWLIRLADEIYTQLTLYVHCQGFGSSKSGKELTQHIVALNSPTKPNFPLQIGKNPHKNPYTLRKAKNPYRRDKSLRVATMSVTTECKMWISQVSNTHPRLSRLLHTASNSASRQPVPRALRVRLCKADTRGSTRRMRVVLFSEKINGLQIK